MSCFVSSVTCSFSCFCFFFWHMNKPSRNMCCHLKCEFYMTGWWWGWCWCCDVWNPIRHGHPGGSASPAGQGGKEHPGVSAAQNSFPTCKKPVTRKRERRSWLFPWQHAYLCLSSVQRNLICCAKKAGLMLFQFPEHLELWRLGESDGHGEENARTHRNTL